MNELCQAKLIGWITLKLAKDFDNFLTKKDIYAKFAKIIKKHGEKPDNDTDLKEMVEYLNSVYSNYLGHCINPLFGENWTNYC